MKKIIKAVVNAIIALARYKMAIHDVDTSSDGRGTSTPSDHDLKINRSADGTTGITPKIDNPSGAYVQTKDAAIIVNDGSFNLARFGYQDDGSIALKIAQSGVSVDTAGDDELVFNSNQNVLKVVKSGTVSMSSSSVSSGNDSTRNVTVTHSLGFAPMVIAIAKYSSTYFEWNGSNLWSYAIGAGSGVTFYGIEFFTKTISTSAVTFTSLYLNGAGGGPVTTQAYTIKYYLLQETAN